MPKDILVFSCAHTDPSVGNERFDWLGQYIADVKPDVVVDLGDGADMVASTAMTHATLKQSLCRTMARTLIITTRLWTGYERLTVSLSVRSCIG